MRARSGPPCGSPECSCISIYSKPPCQFLFQYLLRRKSHPHPWSSQELDARKARLLLERKRRVGTQSWNRARNRRQRIFPRASLGNLLSFDLSQKRIQNVNVAILAQGASFADTSRGGYFISWVRIPLVAFFCSFIFYDTKNDTKSKSRKKSLSVQSGKE